MIQINSSDIRPHIRINGGWKCWEAQESGLTIDQPISKDKWYKCKIFCDKDEINIRLYDNDHCFFNRNWKIPRGNIVFSFHKNEKDIADNIKIPFSINLEYGSADFRNFGDEKAFIKNVLIQKL